MPREPELITTTEFCVASWDVDANNRLTTAAIGRYMQEAAEVNAGGLGAGFEALSAEGQTWVLSAMLLRVERFPRFLETVAVETWPRDIARRRALRDFRIYDGEDDLVATATTAWFCLDLASRRPASPERWRRVDWPAGERATDRDTERLPALGADAEADVAVPLRWSDLDLNGHVTNTRYQDILLESYPEAWLRDQAVAEIELNFLAEGRYPDTLHVRRAADPADEHAWLHALTRASDGKDACRARVVWHPGQRSG